ncbi:MAG: GxxExxY protein [Bacteroidetes bacterium]|jgi:GxxExxY protein|nr:GxxExxY protein [Bacteroidota bacterium]
MIVNTHICTDLSYFSQSRAEINAEFSRENMNKNIVQENDISYEIRGAAFKIHTDFGPGLLESVYEVALTQELIKRGFIVRNQVPVPMFINNIKMDIGFRLDIIVNELVIVEVKSVESLADVHHKQLLTYLKLYNKKLGLLINFNSFPLKDNIIRIVNKL